MAHPYRQAHRNPKGCGDDRPTAQQIIHDEGLLGKWEGKTILITGCSSGIGIPTARALATTGARLFLTVRNVEKGKAALQDILSDRVQLIHMDNTSLASVREGAKQFLSLSGNKLNILICNAGVMTPPTRMLTKDGFELQFETNYLAHFLLFQLVKDALISSSTPQFNSRVVVVSSSGHTYGQLRLDDYNLDHGYDPHAAYGHSKTAEVYLANQIERLYGPKGVHSTSLDPGGIETGLQVYTPQEVKDGWKKDPKIAAIMKNPEQGASTTVYAAVSPEWEGRGGRYLQDCEEAPAMGEGYSFISGYAEWAYDEQKEKKLWEDSLEMVGL